jgi:NAD(P)-dependent dehydrogenase (short-subunit alcohol dehydrogenase family)
MTDESEPTPDSPKSHFPSHSKPRTWLISSGDNPIGLALARTVLSHGDNVVVGIVSANLLRDENRRQQFQAFMAEVDNNDEEGLKSRFRAVMLDIRYLRQSSFSMVGRLAIDLIASFLG